jgi:hypothetical protein
LTRLRREQRPALRQRIELWQARVWPESTKSLEGHPAETLVDRLLSTGFRLSPEPVKLEGLGPSDL